MKLKTSCLLVAALSSSMLISRGLLADSLTTTDGTKLTGKVTKTATGYSVETEDGTLQIPAAQVGSLIFDHPAAAAPVAPVTPKVPAVPVESKSPAGPKKPVDPRMINALLEQGQAAMSAGQYGDARDAFKDAALLDPKNPLAARGLGFAYLALGKFSKANEPLEIAARTPPLDRSMVLALSSSLVASHNAMRAVKYLKPYLETHAKPVDEIALNALGISLSLADSSQARSTIFQDGVKLYMKQNAELESTRPGKKRWGVDWLDESDATAKQDARNEALKKADAANTELQTANARLQTAQNELTRANSNATSKRGERDRLINSAQSKVNQESQAQSRAQSKYDTAKAAVADLPGPNFPTSIVVDDADLMAVLPGVIASASSTDPTVHAANNQVASAAPVNPAPANPAVESPKTNPAPRDPAPADPVAPPRVKPIAPSLNHPTESSDPAPERTATPPKVEKASHITRYAAAFFIAPDVVVTAAKTVDGATTLTVTTPDGREMKAAVIDGHHSDGLVLLKVEGANSPSLSLATSFASGAVTCVGFPEVDLFNPTPRSMNVAATAPSDTWTVRFDTPPRVPGAPLMQNGVVVGVELGDRDSDLTAIPAATLKALSVIAQDSAHPTSAAGDPKQAIAQVTAER